MITMVRWNRGFVPWALSIGLLIVPQAGAHGGRGGGHGGGHAGGGARAPHFSARQPAYQPARMPRAMAATRRTSNNSSSAYKYGSTSGTHAQTNRALSQSNASHSQALASSIHASNNAAALASSTHARTNSITTANGTTSRNNLTSTSGTGNSTVGIGGTTPIGTMPTLSGSSALVPNAYTYGTGRGARSYRAYGYGTGYRNRSYGQGYGYGRSQGLNRGVIAGLMSVRASLTRVAHDYQGHRVRAIHAISMAIRQLSHRSMNYSGMGFASGMNNGGGARHATGCRCGCTRNATGCRRRGASRATDVAGAIRQPDGAGSATTAGDQHAARKPGDVYQWALAGKWACPTSYPRAEYCTLDPLVERWRLVELAST